MLNEIEEAILNDIYEMCLNNGEKPIYSKYNLVEKGNGKEQQREFASYLIKLKTLGYIDFDENKIIVKGGIGSQKYRNNALMTFTEYIKITDKGINYIKEKRKSITVKIKEEIKELGSETKKETRKLIVKTLAPIIVVIIINFIYFIFS